MERCYVQEQVDPGAQASHSLAGHRVVVAVVAGSRAEDNHPVEGTAADSRPAEDSPAEDIARVVEVGIRPHEGRRFVCRDQRCRHGNLRKW